MKTDKMNIEFKKVRKDIDYRHWARKAPIANRKCFIIIKKFAVVHFKGFS